MKIASPLAVLCLAFGACTAAPVYPLLSSGHLGLADPENYSHPGSIKVLDVAQSRDNATTPPNEALSKDFLAIQKAHENVLAALYTTLHSPKPSNPKVPIFNDVKIQGTTLPYGYEYAEVTSAWAGLKTAAETAAEVAEAQFVPATANTTTANITTTANTNSTAPALDKRWMFTGYHAPCGMETTITGRCEIMHMCRYCCIAGCIKFPYRTCESWLIKGQCPVNWQMHPPLMS